MWSAKDNWWIEFNEDCEKDLDEYGKENVELLVDYYEDIFVFFVSVFHVVFGEGKYEYIDKEEEHKNL